MKFPRYGFAVLFGLALFLFTGYLLADTFLITRIYTVVENDTPETIAVTQPETVSVTQQEPAVEAMPAAEEYGTDVIRTPAEPVTTGTTYSDENISVVL